MIVKTRFVLWIGAFAAACASGCVSGREFWTYVVEPPVEKPLAREKGSAIGQAESPHVVRVAYSDGSTSTEVQIPVVSTGQSVVVDQKGRPARDAINLAPLAPGAADKSLDEGYTRSGKAISAKAPPVSLSKSQAMVKKLVKQGNLSLALEYLEQVLQRYPQHAESLRAKGSVLLRMGEREAALQAYRKAQDSEPNPLVGEQIKALEKSR